MSDRATQADIGDVSLADERARWSGDERLAPIFATRAGAVLVLDARAERTVGAFGDGMLLRAAVTEDDGRIRHSLRLGDQLRSLGEPGSGARLIRLRLDPRGIARPTSCLAARASLRGGETVVLLASIDPLPALRASAPRPLDRLDTTPVPLPETPASPPTSQRFVWRSDADGVVTEITGGRAAELAELVGRALRDFGDDRRPVASGLLAALEDHKTFRVVPLLVRLPRSLREVELELSGSPSARAGLPFTGFTGFGVVREIRAVEDEVSVDGDDPAPAEQDEAVSRPAAIDEDDGSNTPVRDTHAAASPPAALVSPSVEPPAGAPSNDEHIDGGGAAGLPGEKADDGDQPQLSTETEDPAARGADLSTNEHAAFREIARALGARFAGDDEVAPAEQPGSFAGRGAVMAFPTSPTPNANTAIDTAIVSALDRLPAGVLVHRDAAILYVNRRFLELTHYPSREALQANGVFEQLLSRTTLPEDGVASDMPVSVTTGGGEPLPLLVERSRVDWGGGPAELMLVRAAAQAEQAREQIARGLRDAREAAREHDARDVLDRIEEGVVTLDESERLLTVNASARAILSSDAREIVGGALGELFAPESAPDIARSLQAARDQGRSAPFAAVLRTGDGAGPLRLRVTRLPVSNAARFCVTMREADQPTEAPAPRIEPEVVFRANFLARIGEEVRAPVKGMLDRAELLLADKTGSAVNEYRAEQLREIHQSGEHLLGVMDDLLDLARIEAGRGDLTFRDIALNDVVSGCIAQMQPQAARDRIVVRTSLSPDLSPLLADERSMRQATLNVLANAIRLTEAGGQVIVSTTAEHGEIAFRVRDTGIGMTEDEIQRALAPYSRAEVAGGRNGSGLALTLSKAIVEANRGLFRITSRKNEGTLVEMLFPPPQALSA